MGDPTEKTATAAENAAVASKPETELTPAELKKKFTLWGLGRGVDITKPTPWLDKTSYQVRDVRLDDLIETDEGGLLKGYSEEVNSSTTIHYQVRAGVKAPDVPLAIGIDSEYSRTDCSNKHVVGLKVKNRTISFRVNIADIAKSRVSSAEEAMEQMRKDKTMYTYEELADADPQNNPEDMPFESRLCHWLCECVKSRGIRAKGMQPHELLFLTIERDGEEMRLIDCDDEMEELQKDITHFIRQLGVTHYVSAIELGGLNFRVLTEKEYERKIALSGSASLNSKLYGAIEATASKSNTWKSKSKREERKMIGKISKGKNEEREVVKPGDEAVIGCQIRPISSLVKNPYLQKAINESVRAYTQETVSVGGPYIISCEGGTNRVMYLTAIEDNNKVWNVAVTFNKKEAKPFSVKTVNETHHRHELEFSLTSSLAKIKPSVPQRPDSRPPTNPATIPDLQPPTKSATTKEDVRVPLEYMLEVVINPLTGKGGKMPRMRLTSDYQRTRLLLKKRSNHKISCDTKDWVKGNEAYYIQCIHPLGKGFLCVKVRDCYSKQQRRQQQQQDGENAQLQEIEATEKECKIEEQYKVCVKGISYAHSTNPQHLMLFRLQPAQLNKSDL